MCVHGGNGGNGGGGHHRFECQPVIMAYLLSMCCSMPYCEGIVTGVFHSGTSDGTAFGQGGEGWVEEWAV